MMKMGVIFVLIQLLSVSAFAKGGGQHPEGGGIPSLDNLGNSKAELADGEVYNLSGTIVFLSDGQPYLQVDFKKAPWLQNAKRVAFPYYQLTGDQDLWHRYQGVHVTYMCIATGTIIMGADGNPAYAISLNPVESSPEESMIRDEEQRGSISSIRRRITGSLK
jgi:hypothetical protein